MCQGWRGWPADLGDALAVELDELADHAVLAQHLGDGEHYIGGGNAWSAFAGQFEPDHPRNQHRHRLAEHRGLRLDAADPPAQDSETVPWWCANPVPTQVSGYATPSRSITTLARYSMLTWCTMPVPGGTTLKSSERTLAPAQGTGSAHRCVRIRSRRALESVRRTEQIGDHRVIDDEIGWCKRIDLLGIAAEVADRLTHGGEVDDAGHA